MKIYSIEYIIEDKKRNQDPEKLRSQVMSNFNNNKIIDAIATSNIVCTFSFISFKFKEPIDVNDE
jgi:hypothetical protein